jgi:hypothetical protein
MLTHMMIDDVSEGTKRSYILDLVDLANVVTDGQITTLVTWELLYVVMLQKW